GMHAVYAQWHYFAAHIGDDANAARWFEEWRAAARDDMSDCRACDPNGQGEWLAYLGRDAEALEIWAPVLGGSARCTEEPPRVLAKSLLPLVRLGRLGEARDNHLRGYRMVRGNPNLRRAVGEHIEFAALTGNEARGLEMLADHAAWLAPEGEDASIRHGFLEAVAVLLVRLGELGHAETPVPTPKADTPTTPPHPPRGPPPPARAAAPRPPAPADTADPTRRSHPPTGPPAAGARPRPRLAQVPLLDALPLGVRAVPLSRPAPPARASGSV